MSIGDGRNPCRPLLQVGTRSPDPYRNWDRMRPPPPPPRAPALASFPPNLEKQNLPPLFGRQKKKARLKETSHPPGFPLHFPLLEAAEASLCPGRRGKLALTVGNRSRPRLGGQEGPRPRAGAPTRSATLAEGQHPHSHTCPAQGKVCGPLTRRRSRSAGAGVGDSVPHPRMPGLPGGPGVTAPHL